MLNKDIKKNVLPKWYPLPLNINGSPKNVEPYVNEQV